MSASLLPRPWVRQMDPGSGRPYFFNTETKEKTTEFSRVLASSATLGVEDEDALAPPQTLQPPSLRASPGASPSSAGNGNPLNRSVRLPPLVRAEQPATAGAPPPPPPSAMPAYRPTLSVAMSPPPTLAPPEALETPLRITRPPAASQLPTRAQAQLSEEGPPEQRARVLMPPIRSPRRFNWKSAVLFSVILIVVFLVLLFAGIFSFAGFFNISTDRLGQVNINNIITVHETGMVGINTANREANLEIAGFNSTQDAVLRVGVRRAHGAAVECTHDNRVLFGSYSPFGNDFLADTSLASDTSKRLAINANNKTAADGTPLRGSARDADGDSEYERGVSVGARTVGRTGSLLLNDAVNGDVVVAMGGGFVGIGVVEPQVKLHVLGNTNLEGTLLVTQSVTMQNTLQVRHGVRLNSTLNVAGVSTLNETVSRTLLVQERFESAQLGFMELLEVRQRLNVSGTTDLASLGVAGNATLGSLHVKRDSQLDGSLAVFGPDVVATGNVSIGGTLHVNQSTLLESALTVVGPSALRHTAIVGNLSVAGPSLFSVGDVRITTNLNATAFTQLHVARTDTMNVTSTLDVQLARVHHLVVYDLFEFTDATGDALLLRDRLIMGPGAYIGGGLVDVHSALRVEQNTTLLDDVYLEQGAALRIIDNGFLVLAGGASSAAGRAATPTGLGVTLEVADSALINGTLLLGHGSLPVAQRFSLLHDGNNISVRYGGDNPDASAEVVRIPPNSPSWFTYGLDLPSLSVNGRLATTSLYVTNVSDPGASIRATSARSNSTLTIEGVAGAAITLRHFTNPASPATSPTYEYALRSADSALLVTAQSSTNGVAVPLPMLELKPALATLWPDLTAMKSVSTPHITTTSLLVADLTSVGAPTRSTIVSQNNQAQFSMLGAVGFGSRIRLEDDNSDATLRTRFDITVANQQLEIADGAAPATVAVRIQPTQVEVLRHLQMASGRSIGHLTAHTLHADTGADGDQVSTLDSLNNSELRIQSGTTNSVAQVTFGYQSNTFPPSHLRYINGDMQLALGSIMVTEWTPTGGHFTGSLTVDAQLSVKGAVSSQFLSVASSTAAQSVLVESTAASSTVEIVSTSAGSAIAALDMKRNAQLWSWQNDGTDLRLRSNGAEHLRMESGGPAYLAWFRGDLEAETLSARGAVSAQSYLAHMTAAPQLSRFVSDVSASSIEIVGVPQAAVRLSTTAHVAQTQLDDSTGEYVLSVDTVPTVRVTPNLVRVIGELSATSLTVENDARMASLTVTKDAPQSVLVESRQNDATIVVRSAAAAGATGSSIVLQQDGAGNADFRMRAGTSVWTLAQDGVDALTVSAGDLTVADHLRAQSLSIIADIRSAELSVSQAPAQNVLLQSTANTATLRVLSGNSVESAVVIGQQNGDAFTLLRNGTGSLFLTENGANVLEVHAGIARFYSDLIARRDVVADRNVQGQEMLMQSSGVQRSVIRSLAGSAELLVQSSDAATQPAIVAVQGVGGSLFALSTSGLSTLAIKENALDVVRLGTGSMTVTNTIEAVHLTTTATVETKQVTASSPAPQSALFESTAGDARITLRSTSGNASVLLYDTADAPSARFTLTSNDGVLTVMRGGTLPAVLEITDAAVTAESLTVRTALSTQTLTAMRNSGPQTALIGSADAAAALTVRANGANQPASLFLVDSNVNTMELRSGSSRLDLLQGASPVIEASAALVRVIPPLLLSSLSVETSIEAQHLTVTTASTTAPQVAVIQSLAAGENAVVSVRSGDGAAAAARLVLRQQSGGEFAMSAQAGALTVSGAVGGKLLGMANGIVTATTFVSDNHVRSETFTASLSTGNQTALIEAASAAAGTFARLNVRAQHSAEVHLQSALTATRIEHTDTHLRVKTDGTTRVEMRNNDGYLSVSSALQSDTLTVVHSAIAQALTVTTTGEAQSVLMRSATSRSELFIRSAPAQEAMLRLGPGTVEELDYYLYNDGANHLRLKYGTFDVLDVDHATLFHMITPARTPALSVDNAVNAELFNATTTTAPQTSRFSSLTREASLSVSSAQGSFSEVVVEERGRSSFFLRSDTDVFSIGKVGTPTAVLRTNGAVLTATAGVVDNLLTTRQLTVTGTGAQVVDVTSTDSASTLRVLSGTGTPATIELSRSGAPVHTVRSTSTGTLDVRVAAELALQVEANSNVFVPLTLRAGSLTSSSFSTGTLFANTAAVSAASAGADTLLAVNSAQMALVQLQGLTSSLNLESNLQQGYRVQARDTRLLHLQTRSLTGGTPGAWTDVLTYSPLSATTLLQGELRVTNNVTSSEHVMARTLQIDTGPSVSQLSRVSGRSSQLYVSATGVNTADSASLLLGRTSSSAELDVTSDSLPFSLRVDGNRMMAASSLSVQFYFPVMSQRELTVTNNLASRSTLVQNVDGQPSTLSIVAKNAIASLSVWSTVAPAEVFLQSNRRFMLQSTTENTAVLALESGPTMTMQAGPRTQLTGDLEVTGAFSAANSITASSVTLSSRAQVQNTVDITATAPTAAALNLRSSGAGSPTYSMTLQQDGSVFLGPVGSAAGTADVVITPGSLWSTRLPVATSSWLSTGAALTAVSGALVGTLSASSLSVALSGSAATATLSASGTVMDEFSSGTGAARERWQNTFDVTSKTFAMRYFDATSGPYNMLRMRYASTVRTFTLGDTVDPKTVLDTNGVAKLAIVPDTFPTATCDTTSRGFMRMIVDSGTARDQLQLCMCFGSSCTWVAIATAP